MSERESLIDAAAVKRMIETSGWQEFVREMNLMIDDLKELLIESDENAEKNRGRIDAIRTILAWPLVVEEEAKMHQLRFEEQNDKS